jgi:hypothetical protein
MSPLQSGVVEVVRDFLIVHERLAVLVALYRDRALSFEFVEGLVGDDESSSLYRLKEKCHAIFRSAIADQPSEISTQALFDLAIGSLFHETMILRENLYQQERYGSRVDALKANTNPLAPELSREFGRILTSSASRLDEAVEEVDVLLAITRNQLLRLLVEESDNELLARCLYEEQEAVAAVFPQGFQALYAEVHGSPTEGLIKAANSYLESAYYDEALEVLSQASPREGLENAIEFASAMQAFLARDYAGCAQHLSIWLEACSEVEDTSRVKLALAAAKYVEKVDEGLFSSELRGLLSQLRERLKDSDAPEIR